MSAAACPEPFAAWQSAQLARVEQALHTWVPADAPAGLGEAMRYAVLDGGKRLRPLLVLAAAEAVQSAPGSASDSDTPPTPAPPAAQAEAALRAACAVELIHAYSLVHDDMPCMDNDVLRRGKPTVHVRFGQAQALLAGDALQALAFELLTPEDSAIPAAMQASLCRLLARAAGADGMAGGQAIDLASVGQPLTEPELRAMHRRKTGALLQASVSMGAACAAAPGLAAARAALADYGAALGLAFQVVDDILDVTADSALLGKTAGKDAAADKPTYVSLLGLPASQALAAELCRQAHHALDASGLPRVQHLRALADLVIQREK
ncbi:polyprenyl synthetase family protein [Comamonadaceae bacterium OH2545_COT-014]|nr:polyprenyl synthetase family protein [Comamonadaceae bacterium OH2545_COT-014]